MNPTKSQKTAIDIRGRSVMVSAAAGSGKTATLTARIISMITDPAAPEDISSMLIVTFTRAAAAELRSRITDAVSAALEADPGNARLADQLTAVASADICTIDSYYSRLVRDNFQASGLPSSFRIADGDEDRLMRLETARDSVEYLLTNEPSFRRLCETLGMAKGELRIAELLEKLESALSSRPGGIDELKTHAGLLLSESEGDFFGSRHGKALASFAGTILKRMALLCEKEKSIIDTEPQIAPYHETVSSDMSILTGLFSVLSGNSYAKFREAVASKEPEKLKTVRNAKGEALEKKELVGDLRDRVKKEFKTLKSLFAASPEEISEQMRAEASVCLDTHTALTHYSKALAELKRSRSVAAFSDLKRAAARLLISPDGKPTPVALAERRRYSHIFVDEYQDTDAVQDMIFRTISDEKNLFIVGDIKQSIYSFRNAEPSVFSSYRNIFPLFDPSLPEGSPCSVYMSENFRCSENIVSFTNSVCGRLFALAGGSDADLEYRPEDDLVFSRKYDPPLAEDEGADTDGDRRVKIILSEYTDKKEGVLRDSRFIGEKISELIAHGKKPGGGGYSYGDFALLARRGEDLDTAASVLSKMGIPVSNCTGESLFENAEVSLLFSLLAAIDNPDRDIHLAGVLCSPVFGMTLDELVTVRRQSRTSSLRDALREYSLDPDALPELREKCAAAQKSLSSLRQRAEQLPLTRFIRSLWRETDAIVYAGGGSDGGGKSPAERRENLQMLYSLALGYESSEYRTLHDFVGYVNGLIENGAKIRNEKMPGKEAVNLLTVHKSKGLEFPVVFILGVDRQYNFRELSGSGVITSASDRFVLSSDLPDRFGIGSVEGLQKKIAVMSAADRIREEELRILYVALTRARDLLYILYSPIGRYSGVERLIGEGKLAASAECRRTVLSTDSWASLISLATCGFEKGEGYTLQIRREEVSDGESEEAETGDLALPDSHGEKDGSARDAGPAEDAGDVERLKDIFRKRFAYRYPYAAVSAMPAKLSVSKLFPDALTDPSAADIDFDEETLREGDPILSLIQAEKLESKTLDFFDSSDFSGAAGRGTATHLFLQFCDFGSIAGGEEAVRAEAERLVREGFIPAEAAEALRIPEIVAFAYSEFFEELKIAREIRREFRFNISLPADRFTTDESLKTALAGEENAVQGVIDLFFTDSSGRLVLCDYKTDRLTRDEMSDPARVAAVMSERHGRQLGYYAAALERICGKAPDAVRVFPLCYGEAVEIDTPGI